MKVQLKDIASFSKGEQINGDQLLADGLYDYLNGGINPSGKWEDFNVEGNTIAISEGGNSCGYVNYMNDRFWCGAHCYYLYDIKCKPKYLYYLLKSHEDSIMKLRSGACMPNIKKKDLGEFTFWYDSDEDYQNKVIELFDILNDIIDKRQRQYSKLDELIKSRFVEMFGDTISNDKGWTITTLDEVADIKIGPFGSLLHKEDYITDGHALVNPSHIISGQIITDNKLTVSDEKYNELAAYQLFVDDIVLGRRGEMGRCAVVQNEGLLCGTGSMIIRPNGKLKTFFLQTILSSPSYKMIIEDKAVGVTMLNLNVPIVSSLTVPLLPIDLQEQFISLLHKVEQQKTTVQNSIDRLETLKKSLMQEYFS